MRALRWSVLALALCAARAGEYCAQPGCPLARQHTLCARGSTACSPRLLAAGMTTWMRSAALLLHNRQRDTVAAGLEPGQPPAANMRKLYWDYELERAAEAWARRCRARHDDCRNTLRFDVLQNMDVRPAPPRATEAQLLADAVGGWFSGARALPADGVRSFRRANCSAAGGCGAHRYAAAAWGSTWRLGCSQALCAARRPPCPPRRPRRHSALHRGRAGRRGEGAGRREAAVVAYTFCNYGPAGNVDGFPMYEAGGACSDCPPGTACGDRTHRALCAVRGDPDLVAPGESSPSAPDTKHLY